MIWIETSDSVKLELRLLQKHLKSVTLGFPSGENARRAQAQSLETAEKREDRLARRRERDRARRCCVITTQLYTSVEKKAYWLT